MGTLIWETHVLISRAPWENRKPHAVRKNCVMAAPRGFKLIVAERRTAHEEMVRHRCRGSRGCCSEGSYGCGSSQRLRSLPVLSPLKPRDLRHSASDWR